MITKQIQPDQTVIMVFGMVYALVRPFHKNCVSELVMLFNFFKQDRTRNRTMN